MNSERIKLLIKQTTTIRYSGPGEIEEFDKEKFAQLIWDEAYQQGYEAGFDQAYETYRITE